MSFKYLRIVLCAALASSAALAQSPTLGFVPSAEPAAEPIVVIAPALALDRAEPSAAEMRRYAEIIRAVGRKQGVEGALIHAIIWAESSYDADAVSRAGASGLMQLMPDVARSYGVRDVFDPEENIRAGAKMLQQLLVQFDGDLELAVAAYNAGPNAVIRAGNRIPPISETAAYVPRVLDHYRRLQAKARNDATT